MSQWSLVNCSKPRIPFFLSSFFFPPFDLIASLPLFNKDTVDMAVWRMLAQLAASKQWHCIGFKQDSIDAVDLLAWLRHCTGIAQHNIHFHGRFSTVACQHLLGCRKSNGIVQIIRVASCDSTSPLSCFFPCLFSLMRCQCDLGFFCFMPWSHTMHDRICNASSTGRRRSKLPLHHSINGPCFRNAGGPKISLLRAGIYLRDALITRLSNYMYILKSQPRSLVASGSSNHSRERV